MLRQREDELLRMKGEEEQLRKKLQAQIDQALNLQQGHTYQLAFRVLNPTDAPVLQQHSKDANLALEAGYLKGVPLPSGNVWRDRLIGAVAHGDGGKDWAVMALEQARASGLA